jgi:UDP-xylose/UDP-N-acetylglucosamine transporter B4
MIEKKYGKHPHEALFYTHLLPLPGFLLMLTNIYDHGLISIRSENFSFFGMEIPVQIFYLIGNVLTQYVCVSSVYILSSECTSLTVTLVLTLRKFVSLVFSVVYFNNLFTLNHWIGATFVLVAMVIFTEIFPKVRQALTVSKISVSNDIENISSEKRQFPSVLIQKLCLRTKKNLF